MNEKTEVGSRRHRAPVRRGRLRHGNAGDGLRECIALGFGSMYLTHAKRNARPSSESQRLQRQQ